MPEFDQARIAHLEMAQNVVSRMAANSFALKALAVALSAGVLAFAGAARDPSPAVILGALVPVVMFWLLDARYLRLERLFRRLCDGIRRGQVEEPFSMDVGRFEGDEQHTLRIAFTWSVAWFYGAIALVLILAFLALAR